MGKGRLEQNGRTYRFFALVPDRVTPVTKAESQSEQVIEVSPVLEVSPVTVTSNLNQESDNKLSVSSDQLPVGSDQLPFLILNYQMTVKKRSLHITSNWKNPFYQK
ncbi:MAG: hypothetical protein HC764_26025 [Pleurocapsa sp. CRU_1_2]|nr:hypothetical protein [Pleurocapsa sp. CRU_1_2]